MNSGIHPLVTTGNVLVYSFLNVDIIEGRNKETQSSVNGMQCGKYRLLFMHSLENMSIDTLEFWKNTGLTPSYSLVIHVPTRKSKFI